MNRPIEAQIAEVGEQLKIIDRQIEEAAAEGATIEARTAEVRRRIEELVAEHETARGNRQTALANGTDAKAISRRLKVLQEEREEREDEVAGLGARLEGIKAQGVRFRADRKAALREVPLLRLRDVAHRYNAAAEPLAGIVAELQQLRSELGEPVVGCVVHTPRGPVGALECVPRLFIPGTEDFEDIGNPSNHLFFDALGVQEKRARRVRPLRVDEDPPALAPGDAVAAEGGRP